MITFYFTIGKYFNEQKQSHRSVKGTLVYGLLTKKENININDKEIRNLISTKTLETKEATHVIVGIQWGANALCTFEYKNSENEEKTEIEGKFMTSFEKFKNCLSVSGSAQVDYDSNEINLKKNTDIKYVADIFSPEQLPTEHDQVIDLLKKMPTYVVKTNDGKGVPVEIELLSIDTICQQLEFEIKVDRLINSLNIQSVEEIEREFDNIMRSKQIFFDLVNDLRNNKNYFLDISYVKTLEVLSAIKSTETKLKKDVASLLYQIRSGKIESNKLSELLYDFQKNEPYSSIGIQTVRNSKLIVGLESKIKFINSLKKINIEYLDKDSSKDFNLFAQDKHHLELYLFKYDENLKTLNKNLFEENWQHFLMLNRTVDISKTKLFVLDYELQLCSDRKKLDDNNNNNLGDNYKVSISHYKFGKLIERDLLSYLNGTLTFAIAKPDTDFETNCLPMNAKMNTNENLYELMLPCPNWSKLYGCPNEELKWMCAKCKDFFSFDKKLSFVCKCSSVSFDKFSYK